MSTTSYVLRGDRLPRVAFVRAYVAACLRARRRAPEEIAAEVERWHEEWLRLCRDAPAAGPDDQPAPPAVPRMRVEETRFEVVPRQLPGDVAGFTGRREQLQALDELLEPDEPHPTAVVITAIAGAAGVGKTALALHWAHRVRDRFPDGQLYANLRGHASEPPLPAGQVLAGFLRAFGTPGERIPIALDEQAAMYRSLLAGKRVLVVLDNAADAEQARPLLAGSPSCAVVVTSRHRLDGLVVREGAHRLMLDVLSQVEAEALLARLLGGPRVAAEPAAVGELARLCGHLPLALRIAAANLSSRPHWTISDYVAELGSGDRLARLRVYGDEHATVRVTFDYSYQRLPQPARRLFRRLGLAPGADLSGRAAAVLAGEPPGRSVAPLLETLCAAHLLQEEAPDRYRFHDLLRVYAAERAVAEEPADERGTAVRRLLAWHRCAADAAGGVLNPHRRRATSDPPVAGSEPPAFADRRASLVWYEAERSNLVAAVRRAAGMGEHSLAWQLAMAMWDFFYLRKYWSDWIESNELGLAAAQRSQDRYGEAWMLTSLGNAYWEVRRYDEALDAAGRGLQRWRELADRWGEGVALHLLGGVCKGLKRYAEGIDYYRRALAVHRQIDNRWGMGWTLAGLGAAHRELHQLEEALDAAGQARAVWRQLGDRHGEGITLNNLGDVYRELGRFEEAVTCAKEALAVNRETGNRWGEGWALNSLGKVLHRTGQRAEAAECWQEALAIFTSLGDPRAAEVRRHLAQ